MVASSTLSAVGRRSVSYERRKNRQQRRFSYVQQRLLGATRYPVSLHSMHDNKRAMDVSRSVEVDLR